MISSVTTEGSTWAAAPQKFEAGTPAIAEAIALGDAIAFAQALGWSAIESHERALFDYAWGKLSSCAGVTLYGPATNGKEQISILPFNVTGVHPHDLSSVADSFNVQIRAGHHCAMPALKRLGFPAPRERVSGSIPAKRTSTCLWKPLLRRKDSFPECCPDRSLWF